MAYQYDNIFWSWNQINIASEIMADELATLGVRNGDMVGIWAAKSTNYIISFFANKFNLFSKFIKLFH